MKISEITRDCNSNFYITNKSTKIHLNIYQNLKIFGKETLNLNLNKSVSSICLRLIYVLFKLWNR